ncbi:MAG TPA: DUF1697 domain-containing protein [Gemmatimonadaceae bacterium]|nr:DUF1697 domain-containing protein [Gemmatimonadaceae bacterium]
MTRSIALLRAINLAGYQRVSMLDLRDFFVKLGFADARTLLQTGNVAFECDGRSSAELERVLEAESAKRLKLPTPYFVRTSDELGRVIARNPFPAEAKTDPSHLVVVFLKEAPKKDAVDALRPAIKGRERVEVVGKQAYITYPDGIGRSKLTNVLIERKLGTRGTARNWNTVLKLAALAQG